MVPIPVCFTTHYIALAWLLIVFCSDWDALQVMYGPHTGAQGQAPALHPPSG